VKLALQPATGFLASKSRSRPTIAFEVLVALSWAVIVYSVLPTGRGRGSTTGSMSGIGAMPGMDMTTHASVAQNAISGLPIWVAMSIAMMLPGALPALDYVGRHSYRWRQQRAMATFVLIYLLLWAAFGVLAICVVTLAGVQPGIGIAAVLAFGALWQLTGFKRQALRDCHRSIPIRASGRRAYASVGRFGVFNGWACLRSCWPAMLAMAIVPSGQMLLMMQFLTATMTAEKLARQPQRTGKLVAVFLGLGGLVALATT
jgi:predicted metal-binding membrane protein